jgi:signal transduction histidine kinase
MTVPVLRTAAVVAATATAAAGVAVFWLAVRLPTLLTDDPSGAVATAPFVLGMVILAGTGALVLRERATSVMGWLLVGTGLAGVLGRLALGLAVLADDRGHEFATGLGWVTNWSWVPAQVLALLLLLRLPDGGLSGRWRLVQAAVLTWGACAVVVTATVPGPLGAEPLAPSTNPLGIAAAAAALDTALTVLFAVQPLLLLAVVAAPLARWRWTDARGRRQLRVVAGALVALAVVTPLAVAFETGEVAEGLAWLLVPASIAYAVVRHGLWDLDVRRNLDRLRGVREAERSRLQRDLHDSLGPMLGSIAMRVEAARNLVAAEASADEVDRVLASIGADTEGAVVEVRRFIDELGPSALAEADLVTALEELVARYREAGLDVTFVRPGRLPSLQPAAEIAVYRVASEALRNVLRHADARRCRVSLGVDGGDVVLDVVDDGLGLRGHPEGVGRRAMAERVADLGGVFSLSEPATGGVHVTARLAEVLR